MNDKIRVLNGKASTSAKSYDTHKRLISHNDHKNNREPHEKAFIDFGCRCCAERM